MNAQPADDVPAKPGPSRDARPAVLRVVIATLAYVAAGYFGLLLFSQPKVTIVWLAAGVGVGLILRWGSICALGIFFGQLIVALGNGVPPGPAILIAGGNSLGSLAAVIILRRAGFRHEIDDWRDILLLSAASAAGSLINAANGIVALEIAGFIGPYAVPGELLKWWVGDWLGIMTVAPLVLLARRGALTRVAQRRGEMALCFGAVTLSVGAIFIANTAGWSLAFVPLPFIAWAGLRFGVMGNAAALLLLSIGASYGTLIGQGPFKWHPAIGSIAALWIYVVTASVLGWLVTTLHNQLLRDVAERRRAQAALQASEEHLRTIVDLDPECVALLSPDGFIREINPAGLSIFEAATIDDLRGTRFTDLLDPADRIAKAALYERVLQGAAAESDFAIVTLRGTRRALEGHCVPYRNAARQVAGLLVVARDVTQRKAAERELVQGFSTLELLINSIPAFISFIDRDLRYQLVNHRYEEYFGLTRDRIVGRRVDELQNAAAFAEMEPHVRRALAGEEIHYESNPRCPDGQRHWFDVRYSPRRSSDGAVLGIFVLVFDITDRKRAQLRSRGERTILEMLASGASLSDSLKTLTNSFEVVFPGMLASVLLLDEDGRRLHHGAAPSLPPAFSAAIDGLEIGPMVGSCGTAAYTREIVLVDDIETDPRWEQFRALAAAHQLRACWSVPVISSQDKVLGTFALYYRTPHKPQKAEISAMERGAHFAALAIERHRLVDSLRESRTRLETLIGNLPGIAFRCLDDEHWTLLYVSEHCEIITGYSREELEHNRVTSFENLIHPEDRAGLRESCHRSLAARQPCYNEYRIIDRSGAEHWVSERSAGVYAESGALLYIDGFIQDITAAREAAREREEFDRKVQETQKLESLGVLAGGIAHDFNNILTAILGNASLALTDAPAGSLLHDCLEDISRASLRATELCSQMLAYSGQGRFVVQNHDLERLIQETTQMLHISISKKATLQFELTKFLPAFEADGTQIRQVIMNLVMNASEALGETGGTITLRTGLRHLDHDALAGLTAVPDAAEGDYIFLDVTDNGCGMTPETQAKIFEPFFTTKFTGRGLGLAAVLGIVRGHRGALQVRSAVGRGTSFRLYFPASSGTVPGESERPPGASVWRGSGTILLVDDEAPVRTTATRMLETIGFQVVCAEDGHAAVQTFAESPARFTLVLLDLTMPGLGGKQTFLEMQRLHPTVKVVLMSGYTEQVAIRMFDGQGLNGFIQKPFDVDSLQTRLRTILG